MEDRVTISITPRNANGVGFFFLEIFSYLYFSISIVLRLANVLYTLINTSLGSHCKARRPGACSSARTCGCRKRLHHSHYCPMHERVGVHAPPQSRAISA